MIYRSLAGHDHDAEVLARRLDGTVDLAVNAGAGDPVHLTKIEVVEHLRPGTCREKENE